MSENDPTVSAYLQQAPVPPPAPPDRFTLILIDWKGNLQQSDSFSSQVDAEQVAQRILRDDKYLGEIAVVKTISLFSKSHDVVKTR